MRSWWIITERLGLAGLQCWCDSLNTSVWEGKRLAFATQRAWCNHVTVIENDRSCRRPTTTQHHHTPRPTGRCASSIWHRNNLMASLSRRHAARHCRRRRYSATYSAGDGRCGGKSAWVTSGNLGRRSGICESAVRYGTARQRRRQCRQAGRPAWPIGEPIKFWRATSEDEWRSRLTLTRKQTLLPPASCQFCDQRRVDRLCDDKL